MKVLITGANRGIGLGFVREYVNRGALVFVSCRKPEQADELKSLQAESSDQMIILPLDVTDQPQIDQCYNRVREQTGSLDRLINNAGILHPVESFRDITTSALMESFAVNAVSPLSLIQRFEDVLARGVSPRIVNITGPTPPISKLPRRNNQVYMASRYAHNALTRMVALELHRERYNHRRPLAGIYPHRYEPTCAGRIIPGRSDTPGCECDREPDARSQWMLSPSRRQNL